MKRQRMKEMSRHEYADWAERWTRDVYRLAARRGIAHGRIMTDHELQMRALARRVVPS